MTSNDFVAPYLETDEFGEFAENIVKHIENSDQLAAGYFIVKMMHSLVDFTLTKLEEIE